MKHLFLFLLLLSGLQAHAQFTLTNSVIPDVRDTFIVKPFAPGTSFNPGPAGALVTWNFASVDTTAPGQDSIFFAPPQDFIGADSFPNATHGLERVFNIQGVINPQNYFAQKTAGAWVELGFYQPALNLQPVFDVYAVGAPQTDNFRPGPDTLLKFPFEFRDSVRFGRILGVIDGKASLIAGDTFPTQVRRYITRTVVCDGYGTLITPERRFDNVLRIKTVFYAVDSSLADIQKTGNFQQVPQVNIQYTEYTNYTWYVRDTGAVFSYTTGTVTNVPPVQVILEGWYRRIDAPVDTTATAIKPSVVNQPGFSLAPNPTADAFTVSLTHLPANQAATLTVLDVTGRVVYTTTVEAGNQQVKLDAAQWAAGLYNVRLTVGEVSTSQKLVVQH